MQPDTAGNEMTNREFHCTESLLRGAASAGGCDRLWHGFDVDRRHPRTGIGAAIEVLLLVHLDEVVDGEDGERHPDRRRRRRADLEHRQADDADGEDDLQIEIVVGGELDLVIDLLDEIDDDAGSVRMAGEEFRLGLDAVGQLVELGIGAVLRPLPPPLLPPWAS